MRVLIYGAGVIGSLYAALISEAGADVSVYARGNRLKELQMYGLRYKKNNEIRTAKVSVLSRLLPLDSYDFILLAVRENQLHIALAELKANISPVIVTMVNSLETYDTWEKICGKGRILPAFPGAGGGFDGDILDAALTPRFIQPTTIGMSGGREKELFDLFRLAMIPCQVVKDMHSWQICHLAMVVPIADAYYHSDDPEHAGNDRVLMNKTAKQIRRNLFNVKTKGIKLVPIKMKFLQILPCSIMGFILGIIFRSRFGEKFMYRHSIKAPAEMRRLHEQFYNYIGIYGE